MEKFYLILFACLAGLLSCGQGSNRGATPIKAKKTSYEFLLGETRKQVLVHEYGNRNDIVMLNLHDDETTSVDAAKRVLEKSGGILISIENKRERLVSFEKNSRQYRFDPNRMFTKKGAAASLEKNSTHSSVEIVETVLGFGQFILDKIPKAAVTLVALHNNDEGRLSINSYYPGGENAMDVEEASRKKGQDPDNFFFTTDSSLYRQLKAGYNTVLQQNDKARDDGSLSVYYGQRNKSYVNVEAEHGQTREQEEMIRQLVSLLETGKR